MWLARANTGCVFWIKPNALRRIQSPWLSIAVQVFWAWQSPGHSAHPEYDLKAPFHENKNHCSCLLCMALLLPAGNAFVLCWQLCPWFCFRSSFDTRTSVLSWTSFPITSPEEKHSHLLCYVWLAWFAFLSSSPGGFHFHPGFLSILSS